MRPQNLHFSRSDGKYSTVQNDIRHMDSYISVWNFRFFKGAPWVCSKVSQFAAYKNRKVFAADLRGAAVCENNHSLPLLLSFCSTRTFKGTVT
jgi:hypothetical protein